MNAREKQLQERTQPTIAGEACVSASTFLVVELDSLTNVCGYFNSETPANNYYGCNHKDCEEKETVLVNEKGEHERISDLFEFQNPYKKYHKQGKCYSFSCPLANQCDLEDLKEYAPDLYEYWKDEEFDPSESGADLMLITDEPLISALS